VKNFKFSIPLTVRVNDLNYGNHVGHQVYFSFFQEARVAYLGQFGFTELSIGGLGMIMAEAGCRYKQQLVLHDSIQVACGVAELKPRRFSMEYQIKKGETVCAEGFTINIGYDYSSQKVARLPEEFNRLIKQFEGL